MADYATLTKGARTTVVLVSQVPHWVDLGWTPDDLSLVTDDLDVAIAEAEAEARKAPRRKARNTDAASQVDGTDTDGETADDTQ